jgi:hypothetical protein
MEAHHMNYDTAKPGISIILNEATMAQVRRSAERDRRIAEDDALNRIQPGDKFDHFPTRS